MERGVGQMAGGGRGGVEKGDTCPLVSAVRRGAGGRQSSSRSSAREGDTESV